MLSFSSQVCWQNMVDKQVGLQPTNVMMSCGWPTRYIGSSSQACLICCDDRSVPTQVHTQMLLLSECHKRHAHANKSHAFWTRRTTQRNAQTNAQSNPRQISKAYMQQIAKVYTDGRSNVLTQYRKLINEYARHIRDINSYTKSNRRQFINVADASAQLKLVM